MEIIGYKSFNKDLINSYGIKFEVGKIYIAQGAIKFGLHGNGFHMCERMEDTLRYFDALNSEICICRVKGSGEIVDYYDEYYGYYDMYAVQKLEILKQLSRDEIIKIALSLNDINVQRFVASFKLTDSEILEFKEKFEQFSRVIATIEYYQENQLDAFVKRSKRYYG